MINLVKSKIKKIYQFVSYQGLDDSVTNRDRDLTIIFNQYLFLLCIIFFVQGIATYSLIGFENDVIFLWITSFACIFSIFFLKRFLKNKYVILSVFIYMILIITYYASVTGVESGCYLYYFTVITAVPIFFSVKKDTVFVLVILIAVFVCLYLSFVNNFQLWGTNVQIPYLYLGHEFLLINLTCKFLFLGINYFFLEEKRNDYYSAIFRNIYKKEQIDNLTDEIEMLRVRAGEEQLSDENFKDLLHSITMNELLFLKKFQKYFPNFERRLSEHTPISISLSTSELALCALLKLGLNTKEIAIYTKASLKAVEGRRYRLRKKLDVPSDIDFPIWFSKI